MKPKLVGCHFNEKFTVDVAVGIFPQPTFQRRINVVSTLWINVDPTLKMKQNPTSDFQRCTMLIQRLCPTLKQRWHNVDTTLFQPSVDFS